MATKPPIPVTNPRKAIGAAAKRFGVSKTEIRDDFGGVPKFAQAALASSGVTGDDVQLVQMAANQGLLEDAERKAEQSVRTGMKFANGGAVEGGRDAGGSTAPSAGANYRQLANGVGASLPAAPGSSLTPDSMGWGNIGVKRPAPVSDPVSKFNRLTHDVVEAAQMSGLPGLHNGPADAYRHSLWTAAMTRKYGSNAARLIGFANEIKGAGQALWNGERIPWDESAMDLKNNETGIRLAGEIRDDQELWRRIREMADRSKEPMSYSDAFALLTDPELVNFPPDGAYKPAVVAAAGQGK